MNIKILAWIFALFLLISTVTAVTLEVNITSDEYLYFNAEMIHYFSDLNDTSQNNRYNISPETTGSGTAPTYTSCGNLGCWANFTKNAAGTSANAGYYNITPNLYNFSTDPFTLCAWVNQTNATSNGAVLIGKGTKSQPYWLLEGKNSGNRAGRMLIRSGDKSNRSEIPASVDLENITSLICGGRNSSHSWIWYNGTIWQNASDSPTSHDLKNNARTTIGINNNLNEWVFSGLMGFVMVFSQSLNVSKLDRIRNLTENNIPIDGETLNVTYFFPKGIIEGDSFNLNISINKTDDFNTSVALLYNNTLTTMTKTEYDDYDFYSVELDAPEQEVDIKNISIVWLINVTKVIGTVQGNLTTNQTVYKVTLTNCSSTLTDNVTINFTVRDEDTDALLNSTMEISATSWIDPTNKRTYTFNYRNESSNQICISPTWANYTTDYSIIYSYPGYQERRFQLTNQAFTNVTQQQTLYLLSDASGIFARFRTISNFESIITGVTASMRISGQTNIIEQQTTDAAGIATFFVDPDTDYNFTFSRSGYLTNSFILRVTSTDIFNVIMQTSAPSENRSIYTGINYDFNPKGILSNNTLYNFTFNLTSSFWTITNCNFTLKDSSDKKITAVNNTDCNLNITYLTDNTTTFILAEGIYEINGTENITVSRPYTIRNTYTGQFALVNFLDDIRNFSSGGFNNFTLMMIAFVIIFALTAFAAKGLGLTNPELLIGLVWALVWFFSYVNWLNMDFVGIPTGFGNLQQYIIFYLMTMFSLGYVLWRNR